MRGREAVNDVYRFDVDALSTSTDLDLAGFIGEELTVGLLQPDGSRRAWHGICTAAEWLGADGGVARYRLRLEPALALLRLRRDSYIFQDKNVRDIVTELFADYPQLRFDFDITQDLPPHPICTQYRESDYDFFVRLMASKGLSWRFEHDQDVTADDGQARHRAIIFDSAAEFPATPGNAAIRFHGVRATDTDYAIDGIRQARASAMKTSFPQWRFLERDFIADSTSSFATFEDSKSHACLFAAEAGARSVSASLTEVTGDARCDGVLASSRLTTPAATYYLALAKADAGQQRVGIVSVARDGNIRIEKELADTVNRAEATRDIKTAKAALAAHLNRR